MKRVLKYIFKYKLWLICGSIGMIAVIALDLCTPMLEKEFLDKGITGGDTSVIIPIIIGLISIAIAKALFGYMKEYLYDITSNAVHENLRNDLFKHIQTLEFAYFDSMNTGELMSRIGEDVETIWDTISYAARALVENTLYFGLSSVILFYLNWKMALACIIVMIPIAYIGMKLEKKFDETYGKISDKQAEINTSAQENIAGVRLVKAFTREKFEIKKFMNLNHDYYDLNMDQAKTIGTLFPSIEFLTNISLIGMIVLGGYLVMNEEVTLGILIAFSNYIWNLIWPMRNFGEIVNMLSGSSASAKKIDKIMNRESNIVVKDNCYSPNKIKGNVEFKNVSFKYNDEVVLRNINLKVPAGSTVAIMGTTGSGKTSLINLIGRGYDVFKGEVLVDGVNVKDYDLNVLRKNMSIVPQDTFLFSDTIMKNIMFSNGSASKDEVKECCKMACCLDFINSLEDGFDTEIGERGLGLSGGQKQRISIARALLRKAPILILDDSTSALDMETEHNLLANLNKKEGSCTTFIIAHRISAVKNADIIIYLEDGQIKESGTHEELLRKKGAYYEVYSEQFKDFNSLEKEVI